MAEVIGLVGLDMDPGRRRDDAPVLLVTLIVRPGL